MKLWITFLLILSPSAFAQFSDQVRDESDLRGTRAKRVLKAPSPELRVDFMESHPLSGGTRIRFVRIVKGQPTAIVGLPLELTESRHFVKTRARGIIELPSCSGSLNVRAFLNHRPDPNRPAAFFITNGRDLYTLSVNVPCGHETLIQFDEASLAGQAMAIWQVAHLGWWKLSQTVSLSFWKSPIEFNFPGNGDYYSFGTVTLTRGDHWDVVGHEMGHAVYDLADLGQFGGGPHKIDECYSEAMAISEGWATFFAGFLFFDLNDTDPKFEYLVPRRAPIRLENVPQDVCRGPRNEWRAGAFFWDLIDLNADSEQSSYRFEQVWNTMQGTRAAGVDEVVRLLQGAGFDPNLVDAAYRAAF